MSFYHAAIEIHVENVLKMCSSWSFLDEKKMIRIIEKDIIIIIIITLLCLGRKWIWYEWSKMHGKLLWVWATKLVQIMSCFFIVCLCHAFILIMRHLEVALAWMAFVLNRASLLVPTIDSSSHLRIDDNNFFLFYLNSTNLDSQRFFHCYPSNLSSLIFCQIWFFTIIKECIWSVFMFGNF